MTKAAMGKARASLRGPSSLTRNSKAATSSTGK